MFSSLLNPTLTLLLSALVSAWLLAVFALGIPLGCTRMKPKDLVIVILSVFVVGLCLWSAVQRADRRKEAEFRVLSDKAMYEAAGNADLQKIHSALTVLLLSDVRAYERQYGAPNGTDFWALNFAAAQAMAKKIEVHLAPLSSIFTNSAFVSKFTSNATIIVRPEN